MNVDDIIRQQIGIGPGAKGSTPMDYEECKRCMNTFALSLIDKIEKEAEEKGKITERIYLKDLKQILNKHKEGLI